MRHPQLEPLSMPREQVLHATTLARHVGPRVGRLIQPNCPPRPLPPLTLPPKPTVTPPLHRPPPTNLAPSNGLWQLS